MCHLVRHADFPSRFVLPRHVDVWLPASYATDGDRFYPAVYMHDGQNLRDPAEANLGVAWAADQALARLAAAGEAPEVILVGL